MPALAIFGAGPALGRSTALRFAHEGYELALVGRTASTLENLAAELRARGSTVSTYEADLADPAQAVLALSHITVAVGLPDAVLWSPGDVHRRLVDADRLDAATLLEWLPLQLLSPLEVAHVVVPQMAVRGNGAFIVTQSIGAVEPVPELASTAVPQAAMRHYLLALAARHAAHGVAVTSLVIPEVIDGSAAARLFDAGDFEGVAEEVLPRIHPDRLAERIWEMVGSGGGETGSV